MLQNEFKGIRLLTFQEIFSLWVSWDVHVFRRRLFSLDDRWFKSVMESNTTICGRQVKATGINWRNDVVVNVKIWLEHFRDFFLTQLFWDLN